MIRQIISIVAAGFIFLSVFSVLAQTKIDPYLTNAPTANGPVKAMSINSTSVEVFIKTTDAAKTSETVRSLGGAVHTTAGQIITASVPDDVLSKISSEEEVIFIEAGKPVQKSNDVATSEMGVTEIHAGAGLSSPYTGKGVVIGIIDSGIDYLHKDFLDANGKNRILAIWDQTLANQAGPSEIEDSYGTECTADTITNGTCPMSDAEGHGTHVSGIAAGRSDKYGGVAPDANIIVVKYDSSLGLESGLADPIFSTKICDAANYVFAKAKALGMPAVVNLSLGTHIGPHDGTSLFEECLTELIKDSTGKAIVAAAGNEFLSDQNYSGIHTGFSVDSSTAASNFVIRKITADRIYYIDIWGTTSSRLSIGLAVHLPSSESIVKSQMVEPGKTASGYFLENSVQYVINSTETASALNGKQHIGIKILLGPLFANPEKVSFDLIVSGKGSFDAWLFPDKPSKSIQFTTKSGNSNYGWKYIPGDSLKTIAVPATARDIIAVTAYATRTKWSANSASWTYSNQELGNILNFASQGPTAAAELTGVKPEIAAPGGMIASAFSSKASANSQLITDDGLHFMQAGTSMAAPFASGTIALIFEVNSGFTYKDAKQFLIQSVYTDKFVGDIPNDRWGYGKLDSLKAIELAESASGFVGANESASQTNDEGSSKGGCSFIASSASEAGSCVEIFAFASVLAIVFLRRRDFLKK